MSEQGIGARVKRVEDKRFITGAGRYTDDIVEPNQAYAAFVRSPHAHAEVNGIDIAEAKDMDGVIEILNGEQLTGDGIGNIICGWGITSKDGSPMNMGGWSALATSKVRYVGDAVAVVIAETQQQARDAAEAVEVDYNVLPAVSQSLAALADGAPQIHENAPGNLIYDWEIGEKAPTEAALAGAAHVTRMDITNNRLSPNPMEPRVAVATYKPSDEHYTLYTTSQNP
ncbi:MAG: molybdopterin cofactor-binding domain-containing protein, partial [Pseudomonadota bacterium]